MRATAEAVRRAPAELAAIAEDLRSLADLHARAAALRRTTTTSPRSLTVVA